MELLTNSAREEISCIALLLIPVTRLFEMISALDVKTCDFCKLLDYSSTEETTRYILKV